MQWGTDPKIRPQGALQPVFDFVSLQFSGSLFWLSHFFFHVFAIFTQQRKIITPGEQWETKSNSR